MKKILYFILVAGIAFDLAAGAYLLHLLNARGERGEEIKSSQSTPKLPAHRGDRHPESGSRNVYRIY